MTFKSTTTWDGFFHPDLRSPECIKLPMPPTTGSITLPPNNTSYAYGILNDTYKTSLRDLKRECIMYENSGTVKWVAGPGWSRTEYLVAEDGAVLDDITYNSASELWHVGSTHINYLTKDQAKAAAVLNMGKQRARCSDCGCEDPC